MMDTDLEKALLGDRHIEGGHREVRLLSRPVTLEDVNTPSWAKRYNRGGAGATLGNRCSSAGYRPTLDFVQALLEVRA
jgi:hypothetical protein